MNTRYRYTPIPHMRQQRGVVLIMALVILLAMTLVSISSMNVSNLEERMSANFKDREVAFQAAEAALRYGERIVEAGVNLANFDTSCTNGFCDHDLQAATTYKVYWTDTTLDVWNTSGRHKFYNVTFAEVAEPAKVIIEHMGQQIQDFAVGPQNSDPHIFRITALGTGQTIKSRVMLQSTYIKY